MTLDLLVDRRLDALAQLVLERRGLEALGGLLLDELARELELGGLHLGLRDLELARRAHFGRKVQLLHREHIADRTQHHEVGLAARRPVAHRAALGLLERLGEQCIGLGRALVGRQIVGLVEVHRVDRLDRHELADIHRVRPGLLERLDLLGREGHVLVLGELVALHHVVALDDRAVLHTNVLLLEARAAGLVQQIEGEADWRIASPIELHRDGDQPE